jgi:hypothetical protein
MAMCFVFGQSDIDMIWNMFDYYSNGNSIGNKNLGKFWGRTIKKGSRWGFHGTKWY